MSIFYPFHEEEKRLNNFWGNEFGRTLSITTDFSGIYTKTGIFGEIRPFCGLK